MPRPGRFQYLLPPSARWTWDETAFHLHGLTADAGEPSTDLLLDVVHPVDRDRVLAFFERPVAAARPACVVYRVPVEASEPRRLAVVAGPTSEAPGELSGYFLDLTEAYEDDRIRAAHEAVDEFVERYADIQQATGQVMLAYGVDATEATALMETWSQDRGVSVERLAGLLLEIAARGDFSDQGLRGGFDILLHDMTTEMGTDQLQGR